MANSVESAFVLLDRASGPIRGIRRELRELEADARKAGLAMDELSGPRSARQMDQLARETRSGGREMQHYGTDVEHAEARMRRLEGRTETLTAKTRKMRLEFGALRKALGILKIPAFIAAIGGAIQVVGGLTAGVVGLTPKVVDLAGVAAAGGTVMVGLGASMGVAKLATMGLSQALGGNKAALKQLTPEGRAFLQTLKSFKPEIDRLKATAQRGLFPGLGTLLSDVKSQAPGIRGIVGQVSGDLGGLARFLGKQITAPGFMKDLRGLGDEGSRSFGAAARSGYFFAHAVEQVLLAAAPFTDWLGNAVVRLAKMTDEQAKASKESGRLGDFFDRTRKSIIRIGDTGKNVFHALGGTMRAARGEGDSLWFSIDKATAKWDRWSNSVTGQTSMRRWFDDTKPALVATVGLVGALAKAVASLTTGPEGAQMLNALHDAMPAIAGGVKAITSSLGPAVVSAFGAFVGLLGDAAGQSGPLTLLARSVGFVASSLDKLLRALGPAGHQIAAAVGMFLLLRKLKVFDLLDTLRSKWTGVGVAAQTAGGRERGAILSGGIGGGIGVMPGIVPAAAGGTSLAEGAIFGGLAGGLGSRVLAGGAGTALRAGESMTAGGVILPTGVASVEGAAAATGGAGALSRLIGGGRGVLGGAGKLALPLLAAQGVFGALGTPGGLATKLQGGASAASFGLVPRPVSLAEKQGKGAQFAGGIIDSLNNQSDRHTQQRQVVRLRKTIGQLPGNDALDQNSTDLATATRALRRELARREQILHESERNEVLGLRETSVKKAVAMTTDFQHAYEVRAKKEGPEAAMRHTVGLTLNEMRQLAPAGRKVMGENMLAWVHEQEHQNPKLKAVYQHLEDDIKRSFSRVGKHVSVVNDTILTGSTSEWKQIHAALSTQTEGAREDVTKGFTAIQLQAIGSLTAMGFSPSQAHSLVYGMQQGGSAGANATAQVKNVSSGLSTPSDEAQHNRTDSATKSKYNRARGGRLPGSGLQDTVRMSDGGYGAPGELVVNRHTEADIDRMAGMNGFMDRMVANETRPNSSPRRATGGRTAEGGPHAGGGSGGIAGHPELHAGISKAGEAVLSRFPSLQVTSTTSGGHVPGSYHYKGEAVDIAGASDVMNRAASWIKSSGLAKDLTEGIHNPNLAVKYGQIEKPPGVFGSVWAGHANHIHMAVAGALSALGLTGGGGGASLGGSTAGRALSALKVPRSGLGGVPGALADRANAMYAAGLQKKINKSIGGGADSSTGVLANIGNLASLNHMYAANGGYSFSPSVVAKIAQSVGLPGQTFSQIAHGESRYQPGAVEAPEANGAQGFGLFQITTKVGNDAMINRLGGTRAMLNPLINARAAKELYDAAGGIGPWHGTRFVTNAETGKRLGGPDWGGWNAKGGDFTVNRPTVFGAGERGEEHVSIRPKGSGGGGHITVAPTVHLSVAGGASKTLQAYVEKRLEEFAHTLADEIENGIEEDEGALIS